MALLSMCFRHLHTAQPCVVGGEGLPQEGHTLRVTPPPRTPGWRSASAGLPAGTPAWTIGLAAVGHVIASMEAMLHQKDGEIEGLSRDMEELAQGVPGTATRQGSH